MLNCLLASPAITIFCPVYDLYACQYAIPTTLPFPELVGMLAARRYDPGNHKKIEFFEVSRYAGEIDEFLDAKVAHKLRVLRDDGMDIRIQTLQKIDSSPTCGANHFKQYHCGKRIESDGEGRASQQKNEKIPKRKEEEGRKRGRE
ncbi:hypothetical protein R3P38DRAFT_2806493 [Favolaschia claudopus]|uniref:Uncharacterized protein n=1 Tax=Favolaschia claudopus TaxID=2862362 RepID=A0AAV9ZJY0_9AGAR